VTLEHAERDPERAAQYRKSWPPNGLGNIARMPSATARSRSIASAAWSVSTLAAHKVPALSESVAADLIACRRPWSAVGKPDDFC